ncbi:MAG: hypothetical protein WDO73_27685 [Ignavibacteriota bacterium]
MTGLCAAPVALHAQFSFNADGRDVQVHSFATQGFLYSNQNNYLTTDTTNGSFAFTDFGANIGTKLTDNFRVGAQVYFRNVGAMGNFRPTLDWALGSYQFKSWFGIRGGRVKTTLGLYNDVQDMDSLHTFALLPESIYPIDWRTATIAHDGGDVFGDIAVKHLGTFSYVGWAGMRPQDSTQVTSMRARGRLTTPIWAAAGWRDLRWTTPVGAVFGVSYRTQDIDGRGTSTRYGAPTDYHQTTNTDQLAQYYGQYTLKGFRLDVEYRRNIRDTSLYYTATPTKTPVDTRAWYVAGTYRISKRFEVGAYRSVYIPDDRKPIEPMSNHQYDTVVGGRVNLTHNWYAKVEGHFFDGAPTVASAARGFYTGANPAGLQNNSRLLVIRTGISF